jgi:sugar lactone lactonase YvrE
MTITVPPRTPVAPKDPKEESHALLKEARRRRRLRWFGGAIIAACVGALIVGLLHGGDVPRPPAAHGSRPSRSAPLSGPSRSALAAGALLDRPQALAVDSNGDVFISNQGSNQVLVRLPSGKVMPFAGDGHAGLGGDNGPAVAAELNVPQGIAVGGNGVVYVADSGNNRIRAVAPGGVITTVAEVADPTALCLGPSDSLYVVDGVGIQQVASDGAISTILPLTSDVNRTIVNEPAIGGSPFAFFPSALAATSTGDLYIANSSPKLLLDYANGALSLVGSDSVDEGGPYVTPNGLVASPSGAVYVGDYGAFAVDRVVGTSLTSVFTFALHSVPGLDGFRPSGVAVTSDGTVYVDTDGVNGGSNRPALVSISPDGRVHLLAAGRVTS